MAAERILEREHQRKIIIGPPVRCCLAPALHPGERQREHLLPGLIRHLKGAVVPIADRIKPGVPHQVACCRLHVPAQESRLRHLITFLIHGQAIWTLPKTEVKKVAREHAAQFKLNVLQRGLRWRKTLGREPREKLMAEG